MKGKRSKDEDDDNISDFVLSEDEGYTGNDKLLLERHRKNMQKKANNTEEELFAFDDSDAEAKQDEAVEMDSDIEGASSDGDLPDVRAWGQHKRNFYSTDYVDQDYGGLGAQEEEAAEMEEAEARTIQKRLAEQLEDADFSLDVFSTVKKASQPVEEEDQSAKEQIKTDLTKLTKRQKLELLQKESPEFAGLVEEFQGIIKKKECAV